MRLNKKHIFVTFVICILVICAVCFCLLPKTTLALNGQSKEVVTLNSTYVELGTNIKDA